jgi:hypothetical protein
MFFFRKTKIVVDAFNFQQAIVDAFPIAPASNFIPSWWKNLPNQYERKVGGLVLKDSTIKRCDGFLDLYKSGFIIPLWCDLVIGTDINGGWAYEGSENIVLETHNRNQYGSHFDDKIHIKIKSPWLFREKSGVRFHWNGCLWNDINNKFIIPNGVVDYKYQVATHINMFTPKVDSQTTIEAGTPMAHIIPLTDKIVEVRNHCLGIIEYDKLEKYSNYHSSFMGNHKKKKKLYGNAERKCPFGFGS